MTKRKKTEDPPKEPSEGSESRSPDPWSEPPKPQGGDFSKEEESESPKIGRKTLALILGHLEKRETENDKIVSKQNTQWWWVAVLLVLGLLASIGVAGAVKLYGQSIEFSPPSEPARK